MPRKKKGVGSKGALAMKERLRKKKQIVEKAENPSKLSGKAGIYSIRKKKGRKKISGRTIGEYKTGGSGRLGGSSRTGGSGRLGGGSKIGGGSPLPAPHIHKAKVYPGGSALVGAHFLSDSAQVFQGNKNSFYPAFRRKNRRLTDFKGRLAHKSGRVI